MIPAEGRVGRQVSPGDESYPLVRQEKGAKGRAWPECCCRPYVRRCLLFDHNPRFAECAELAARSAFSLVICGLPFLLPAGVAPNLDSFVDSGFYAVTVVSFIVLHIKTNLGSTMAATCSGLRAVVLAVCNAWCMFGLFPDGYTEEESIWVWWFGFAEGLLFLITIVHLNFDTGAMVFSIKLFSGYWMHFLKIDQEGFRTPWTPGFSIYKNKGIQDLTNVVLGAFLTILIFLFPYPLTALQAAQEAATVMSHEVPYILRLFVKYLEDTKSNDYEQDRIMRNIRRLQRKGDSLSSNVEYSWWECFGWGSRQADRVALRRLEKVLRDCYDSIHGIWSVSELRKGEERGKHHLAMIEVIRVRYLPLLNLVEELIEQVVFVGSITQFSDAQKTEVLRLIQEIRAEQAMFREAFFQQRSKCFESVKENEIASIIQELEVVHTVACHMMMVINGFVRYAEKTMQESNKASYLCDMEGFGFRDLFKGVTTMDNVRYSMRMIFSVLLGFFTGYSGSGMVTPGSPAIAKATATLLSKFPGSALVKNLNRIQGVVLGTVFGQLLDTIFHRSTACSYFNEVLLGCCFASYIFATVFIHFYVTDFAIMGIQMANFGGTEMMTGGCGEKEDTGKAYSKITTNLLAIIFIVLVDLVFASERASDMAAAKSQDLWVTIKLGAMDVLDPDKKVTLSSVTLETELSRVESLGREASHEPRYHRIAWREQMFDATLKEMQEVRYALSTLERILAENGQDGAKKVPYFRSTVLQTSAVQQWAAVLREKFDLISSLLEVFSHETNQRWPMLDDEKVTKQFRVESEKAKSQLLQEIVRLELYKQGPLEPMNNTSFRDDPLCMLSIFLACSDAMLVSMRQIQHNILRLY